MSFIFFVLGITLSLTALAQDSIHRITYSNFYLTDEEKQWLSEHPVITISGDPDWAPFEYYENNEYKGLTSDYVRFVERKLNIKFKIKRFDTWDEVYKNAVTNEVDVISGIVPTPERRKYFNFTAPYLSNAISIFAHEDFHYVQDLSELKGKKVGVVQGYFTEEFIREKYPEVILVPVKSVTQGLKSLNKGKLTAFVESMPVGSYYIYKEGFNSIRVIGETPYNYDVCMAVRKDWPMLQQILQKTLNSMTKTESNNIYNNWITIKSKEFDYSLLLKIISPILVILFIVVYWNRKLNKEVKERKKAQEELNEAFKKIKDTQTHLVQSEKMASVGILTAGIAHEIKNPLSFVMLGIESIRNALKSLIKTVEKYEEYTSTDNNEIDIQEVYHAKEDLRYEYYAKEGLKLADALESNAQKIVEITDSLNTFSYDSDQEKTLTNINESIESSLLLLSNEFKYNVEIVKELNDIPEVFSYPGKLNQVFLNVISNAIQSIENQGTIWVKTFTKESNLFISVKDSGSGITKENIDKIFDAFYTTKSSGKGTGLGLTISKNIISEHDGTIEVVSTSNEGTEFLITLPLIHGELGI